MNTRAFTLALIISAIAMFMVYSFVEDKEAELTKIYGTPLTVLKAKVDINELELIDDSKVVAETVPGLFKAPGGFKDMKEIENTIAAAPILKGEQITKSRIIFPGAKTGLSRQVGVGKRAIAIPVNDQQAVSKLIKPGDRVDIISVIDFGGGRKDLITAKTVLQDVLVLSTGLNVTNSIPIIGVQTAKVIRAVKLDTHSNYNTVTVELTPFQAQRLIYILANMGGAPYLSLRNNSDKKPVRIEDTNIFEVLGDDADKAKRYFNEKYQRENKGR